MQRLVWNLRRAFAAILMLPSLVLGSVEAAFSFVFLVGVWSLLGGLMMGIVGLLLSWMTGDVLPVPLMVLVAALIGFVPCVVVGFSIWRKKWFPGETIPNRSKWTHGSARFADGRDTIEFGGASGGLLIGRDPYTQELLRYHGPAHLLTLAPTRAGKGVGTIIPNLLMAERPMLVIDPKGENARIAGAARSRFGPVHVLDPFGVSGHASASLNPLDRLRPDNLDLGEDAATLADALVMDPPGQVSEAHWNEEAKALLGGLTLFAALHEEPGRRNLGTVREYLTLPPDSFAALLKLMQDSDQAHGLIARAANRFLGKADREAASVMSNAQRHTHFLDSPRMAKALERSTFRFSDLRRGLVTVFLVLPPNRLDAYARWLRLMVTESLYDIARYAEDAQRGSQSATGASGATIPPALLLWIGVE